jgi:hypothetical protein
VSDVRDESTDFQTRVTKTRVRRSVRAAASAGALVCLLGTSGCGALSALRSPPPKSVAPKPAAASDKAAADEAASDDLLPDNEAPELSLASEDDFVVRVVAGAVSCSGALIAEDRVLTAHHCVAVPKPRGGNETKDLQPEAVRVELGGDHLPWGEVGVRFIVAPSCGHNGGDGDIAILVLDRRLNGVATRPAEIDMGPKKGDRLVPIGFGRCAEEGNGISRHRRTGSPVGRILERRFQLEAAICPGDSGGPGVDPDNGRILGVISASVMDSREATLGLSEFTRLDQHRAVFSAAAQLSEGATPAELPPIDCR